jgi:hypothetical protein
MKEGETKVGFNLNDIYPSAFFKAADLNGATVVKEIADVTLEEIGTDRKLVLHFKDEDKGLVLNKTNSNNIAIVYGMDTDGWIGGIVQLYPTMVDFQGRSMEAIRLKATPRPSGKRQGPPPGHAPSKHPQQGFSDTGPTRPRRTADDPRTMARQDREPPFDDDIPM